MEAVLLDPDIKLGLDKMAEYNEMLKNQAITQADVIALRDEVDHIWKSLIGHNTVFTGFGTYPDSEGVSRSRSYYDAQNMVFNGVCAVPQDSIFVRENTTKGEEMEYELRVSLICEAINSQGEIVKLLGTVSINDIISLEIPGFMSTERAHRWLEYYYPEMIAEIDINLLNLETDNECELLNALRGFACDLNQMIGDKELHSRTKEAFRVYFDSLFNFDRYVGYGVSIDGEGYILNENAPSEQAHITAYGIASNVLIRMEDAPSDPSEILRPHVQMTYHMEDKDDRVYQLLIPLDSVKEIMSLRRHFFTTDTPFDSVEE